MPNTSSLLIFLRLGPRLVKIKGQPDGARQRQSEKQNKGKSALTFGRSNTAPNFWPNLGVIYPVTTLGTLVEPLDMENYRTP
jgi:hypothetical protein